MKQSSLAAVILLILGSFAFAADYQVGVASVDITPDYPIRLNGFGHRRAESEGVTQKIYAKAMAIVDASKAPAVLMAVDALGVPDYMTVEVARRLKEKAQLDPARLAITATHTHTAPMLSGNCPTIFGEPIPDDQQQRIDRYTKELTDKLEEVALAAMKDLKPATIEWASGSVGFAINRRTPGGPVDHDLPLLAVRDAEGKFIALNISYACHCVTLSHNRISGDWAGYAAELIEKAHPGAVALTSIGCGADSNPSSNPVGDRVDIAQAQAKQIADEVQRLLKRGLAPITSPIDAKLNRITLPFDTPPTREHWETLAQQPDAAGYHARVNLARLDRGETLQTEISYPIQTWTFGDELAMVFLPGEVVVDYALRLKRELDRTRLWVNAYSNDVPCYIPSERILREGGYEGAGAMIYYDRPTRLAPGVEQKIIDEIHRQLPEHFRAPPGTEGVAPRAPQQSLRSMRAKPGLKIELVASEPLIQSPVAIDFGADGRLWVCEMYDYPTGVDGAFQPGGRVKFLTDSNGDGQYDRATVFADNLPFPTGVMEFGDGMFICAAPDILFARDTNNDGQADEVNTLFTGFSTENYQTRVNSLSIGLDNWIYGANGLLTGTIRDLARRTSVELRNHDFRFRPIDGPMEPVTGLTQYGRVRDDFGNHFGCDNSRALLHFPYEHRYLSRNPLAPSPPAIVVPKGDYDIARVYPQSRTLERYNDPDNANRFTSASGIAIYRDTLLGEQYAGNAFTCEPVHNLVHRMILEGDGQSLTRRRADDERESEFFTARDNWSRPVQVRTGPDGALYIVDMYRFLIEHPRWIPGERLAAIDVRAGSDKGRIYRISPAKHPLRAVRDLSVLSPELLARSLDSPNGTERDRVHVALLARRDSASLPPLRELATQATLPQVRIQALSALDGLNALPAGLLEQCLRDPHPRVRAHALRFMERTPRDAMLALVDDPSPLVRRQLAFSLGEWSDPRAGAALAKMTKQSLADAELRVAILSSATPHCGQLLAAVMSADEHAAGRAQWTPPLVATAAASKDEALMSQALAAVLPREGIAAHAAHFAALASLLDARPQLHGADARIAQTIAAARVLAADADAPEQARIAALSLLARNGAASSELDVLCNLIIGGSSDDLRAAAINALRRRFSEDVATKLLARWAAIPPVTRAQVVSLLLEREAWSLQLLETLAKRRVHPTEIALPERLRLRDSDNAEIRQRSAAIFTATTTARDEVVGRYQSVAALVGAATSGKELFVKNCAACHEHNGVGNDIGAPLAALRGRETDYLVKQILDPSAVVEPRFVNYVVTTTDGRTLSGIIRSETPAAVTLASGGGSAASIETIARGNIKAIRATSVSMMPDGFEDALSPQQMADVIAFIRSGAPAHKQLAGNEPARIAPALDGSIFLPASKAEIYGERIIFEHPFANIGYWEGAGDHVAWTFSVFRAQTFDVYIDYACADSSAGNSYAIEAGGQRITGVVAGSGPDWSRYVRLKVGSLKLDAGEHLLTVRPDAPPRSALIDLRTVALVPQGAQPKWPVFTMPAAAPSPSADLPRDAAAVAKYALDPSRSSAAREAAINSNPQFAADLIVEMTRDLTPGTPQEYERIPWIWRVSIAAGKRNDGPMLKRILEVSLPKDDQRLRDWQAVVIGGGIINGISQRDLWPGDRIAEVIGDDAALQQRWQRALDLSSAMADDENVPTGTRYDALRMLGVEPWEKRGEQLVRYLGRDVHAELQMGAVSGLADVKSPHAAAALRDALPNLTESNRKLAEAALRRHEAPASSS